MRQRMSQNLVRLCLLVGIILLNSHSITAQDEETTVQTMMEDTTELYKDDISVQEEEQEVTTISTNDGGMSMENEEKGKEDSYVEIQTILGSVRGIQEADDDSQRPCYAFKGIPYALPPVGNLRFMPPVPAAAFGSLDARKYANVCPQQDLFKDNAFIGDEDCLYLNVYSPSLPKHTDQNGDSFASPSEEGLKPVMVFIHGGGFTLGAGSEFSPRQLVTTQDIVVVSINYRLGALGFLNLGNGLATGNQGLRDQIQALRWVQGYIHHFGGDSSKVTIFGESAGSISVHALVLSPLASGLFSGAISQSGNMLMTGVYTTEQGARTGRNLAEMAGCETNRRQSVMQCLQELEVEKLVTLTFGGHINEDEEQAEATTQSPAEEEVKEGEEAAAKGNGLEAGWWPQLDGTASTNPVLPLDPLVAMELGAFNRVPYMMGTVKNEGAFLMTYTVGYTDEEIDRDLAVTLGLTDSRNTSEVTENEMNLARIVRKYYASDAAPQDDSALQEWSDLYTDGMFLSPDQIVAQLTSRHNPYVFNYLLTHSAEVSLAPLYGLNNRSDIHPVHGDDLLYLFSAEENYGIPTEMTNEDDLAVQEKMMTYWGNFAKYGNPSPFINDDLTIWLPYMDKKNYLELKPEVEMRNNIQPERMLFWDQILWNQKLRQTKGSRLLSGLKKFLSSSRTPFDGFITIR